MKNRIVILIMFIVLIVAGCISASICMPFL